MRWYRRRWAPWLVIVLHASAGTTAAGLVAAGSLLGRQRSDPIPCLLDACAGQITVGALLVATTYLLAAMGTAVAVGASEVTGSDPTPARALAAAVGPPVLWMVLASALW